MAVAVLLATGLVLYFVVANLVDMLVYRLVLSDDLTYNHRRETGLNVVRPTVQTVIIFGGGMLTAWWLGISGLWIVPVAIWFFFLTQMACLAGRGLSLSTARWAMLDTMGAVLVAYWLLG
jgi:uncharacterized membrane protein YhhN